jgi:hypothetical protein
LQLVGCLGGGGADDQTMQTQDILTREIDRLDISELVLDHARYR